MPTIHEHTYVIEGMSCGHCKLSMTGEIEKVPSVESIEADVVTGRLSVRGDGVDDAAVRAAVAAAGYRVAA